MRDLDDDVKGLKIYPSRELLAFISCDSGWFMFIAVIKLEISIPGRIRHWARSKSSSLVRIRITDRSRHMVSRYRVGLACVETHQRSLDRALLLSAQGRRHTTIFTECKSYLAHRLQYNSGGVADIRRNQGRIPRVQTSPAWVSHLVGLRH